MSATRRLVLAKETLSDLTNDDLRDVVAGAFASGVTCQINSDRNCLINWPTKEGCTPAAPQ